MVFFDIIGGNMHTNIELVIRLYSEYSNWQERTKQYNLITGHNKTLQALKKAYSRNKPNFTDDETHESERYQELSTCESITEEQLLELHGYEPSLWQITSSNSTRSKIGTKSNEQEYFINTYSKITVKRRVYEITNQDIQELINRVDIKPIMIDEYPQETNGMLEIPLFDAHFGNNTYEEYKEHQGQIANYIKSQGWEQTLFIIGQDLFHNDDFKGHTSNGTPIEKEDMEQAFDDAHKFYQPLIELALEHSTNVDIIYSRGNHDETMGWAFVKSLEIKYPQVTFCTKQAEHKAFIYKDVFLGYTHGDKINDKKIVRNFESLFRLEMAQANRRILKKGHIHTLKSFDDNGTQVITLGTANQSDGWHTDNGFVGNHKAFEIFIYNNNSMKAHIYID